MGTVACCKKPNEMVEDQDVFKKSTIKKTMNFQVEQIEQEQERQNPFQKANSRQNINNNNQENTNNVLDLEETKKTNNLQYIHQIEHQIEHQGTNGPSDNLRKKNITNIKRQILTNNNNTMNTSEQTQVRTNSKFINRDNNINEQINTINDNIKDNNIIKEKEPTDKISLNNTNQNQDKIHIKEIITDNNINNMNMTTKNNIIPEREPFNNAEKIPIDSERMHEKKNEPLNSQNINNQIKDEPQNNNIKIRAPRTI